MFSLLEGVINGIFIAGLGIFLAVALKKLPPTSSNRKFQMAALVWLLLFGTFILLKGYMFK